MNQQQIMEIFNDPLSQELLHSNIPARMAYTGDDGFPRAIAIGFYWNGLHHGNTSQIAQSERPDSAAQSRADD